MRIHLETNRRTASVLPLTVICLVALLGFVALAIDIGMVLVARTHCQNAADAAAMAGCRTLNGDVDNNNNYSNVGPNVMNVATSCQVLKQPIIDEWVSHEIGYYTYNRGTNKFGKILPSTGGSMPSNENWSLVTTRVSYGSSTYFAKVLGINSFQVDATATAVHRPRDIAIIVDFSGSMSFDSLLGAPYNGARTQSLNPETVRPQFGHYSAWSPVATSAYVLSSGEVLGLSNLTVETNGGPAMVNDYFQNVLGGTPLAAFTPAPDSYATAPGGDTPLKTNFNATANPYASRLQDVLGTTTYHSNFETNGYSWSTLNGGTSVTFKGYTQGPRHWGKTFFIWPPDPRTANDWRRKFFLKSDKVTPVDDNSLLWTTGTSPTRKAPRTSSATNYYINYAAILRWLQNTGPNPFPPRLRAGKISYYTAFPNVTNASNDATFNNRMYVQNPTDLNERFWKHYIDFVLGFQQTGTGPVYSIVTSNIGYGADFNWGTRKISTKPTGTAPVRYMDYADNPPRPKTGFWFGPLTLLDFLDNYNQDRRWCPGTAHQVPTWGCKIGMRAAMLDIKNNHPNDYVALTFFSTPEFSANDGGRFNRVRSPLGRNYQRMVDSLFYPPATLDDPANYPEINCYDSTRMNEVPRARGATCPVMSFMHAYNQFSSNSSLLSYNPSPAPTGDAGGLGRIGAQKVIIFETDGMANQAANATFQNYGPYQSYYRVRIPGEYPSNSTGTAGSVQNQLYSVAQTICNSDTASTPGYSTTRKPVLIHCIAYGNLFDTSVAPGASSARNQALTLLQQVQYIGKTQTSPSTALPDYKVIIGTSDERVSRLQQAFQKIMQDTVSVTLIE